MYVVWFEGETAGVHDLGLGVNVTTFEVSVLTGQDVQAIATMVEDDMRVLTYDRFGVVHAEDSGVVDRVTVETLVLSNYEHTQTDTRVPFIAIPNPRPVSTEQRTQAAAVTMLLAHRDARGPVVRPVMDTINLQGTDRVQQQTPQEYSPPSAPLPTSACSPSRPARTATTPPVSSASSSSGIAATAMPDQASPAPGTFR